MTTHEMETLEKIITSSSSRGMVEDQIMEYLSMITPEEWWIPTSSDIGAWVDRHALRISVSAARDAIEDARTLHLLIPPPPETSKE